MKKGKSKFDDSFKNRRDHLYCGVCIRNLQGCRVWSHWKSDRDLREIVDSGSKYADCAGSVRDFAELFEIAF